MSSVSDLERLLFEESPEGSNDVLRCGCGGCGRRGNPSPRPFSDQKRIVDGIPHAAQI